MDERGEFWPPERGDIVTLRANPRLGIGPGERGRVLKTQDDGSMLVQIHGWGTEMRRVWVRRNDTQEEKWN